jgi:hypothetical protein
MTQSLIQEGLVQLISSSIANTSGDFTHVGDYFINGVLTVDTINVKNLIAEEGDPNDIGNWVVNTEAELNGKGLSWAWGEGNTILQYRAGNRLWTNGAVDLAAGQQYKIDNVPVLSANSLGDSIVNSKLKTIGTLNDLKVSGDATLGDFFFVNSTFNKIGIGTEDPAASLTILDNNVEIHLGSPDYNIATIGTASNHDFAIISDNQSRITVKQDGEVHIGNEKSRNGLLRVFGSIYVDNLIADTRVDRSSALEFSTTRDQSIYGLGLIWSGTGPQRELVMYSDPDRIRSSENIDIAEGRSYYINGQAILSSNKLGGSVIHSDLITLGLLEKLDVQGTTNLIGDVNATHGTTTLKTLLLTDGDQNVLIDNKGVGSFKSITISSAGYEAVYADATEINIGDRTNNKRPIKVFGNLSIGIANPDPSLQFAVNGDISVAGKRFTNATAAPVSGSWNRGDICWNTEPLPSSYIGWTCIQSGAPGTWLGFGLIASQ